MKNSITKFVVFIRADVGENEFLHCVAIEQILKQSVSKKRDMFVQEGEEKPLLNGHV